MPIALKTLIKKAGKDEDVIIRLLESFSCKEDRDIEFFLKARALPFEKTSKACTYLICDENQIKCTEFKLKDLKIYGYVSVALHLLYVSDDVSNRMRKELDGFSSKKYGKPIEAFPCYLVGQLSRNSDLEEDYITGSELIELACNIINTAVDAVGGRFVMIECQNLDKLIKFYEDNKFIKITSIADGNKDMVQMIRKTN